MVGVIAGENSASITMHRVTGFVDVGVLHCVGFRFGEWMVVTTMQRGLQVRFAEVGLFVDGVGDLLEVGRGECLLGGGDGEQGWVELNEGGVHGSVIGVARVAVGGEWSHLGGLVVVEAEEGPLARKA